MTQCELKLWDVVLVRESDGYERTVSAFGCSPQEVAGTAVGYLDFVTRSRWRVRGAAPRVTSAREGHPARR